MKRRTAIKVIRNCWRRNYGRHTLVRAFNRLEREWVTGRLSESDATDMRLLAGELLLALPLPLPKPKRLPGGWHEVWWEQREGIPF